MCVRNQTYGDGVIIKIFNDDYDVIGEYFNHCVEYAIEQCDDNLNRKNLVEEIKYSFCNGFKNDGVVDPEADLIIWAILNYEPSNFSYALGKTAGCILETSFCYDER